MALTYTFFEAIKSENLRRIRIMMKDSLLIDPSFEEFEEMEKEAKQVRGLYEEHDGRELIMDRSQWDDFYMDKLMVQVVNNFSYERIKHLKDVVRYLRPVTKKKSIDSTKKTNSKMREKQYSDYQEQKRRDQREGRYLGSKMIVGVAGGAAVGGIVASALGTSVLGGAVVGAVVGGMGSAVILNEGK